LACVGDPDDVRSLELTVEDQPAVGLYAVPDRAPRGLVVFFHGYTETMESWREHIARVASQDDVIAVAMNYRGLLPGPSDDPLPGSTGMPLVAGAQDGIAAAHAFDAACPGLASIVAYGNSLGGGIAGLAVAAGEDRADGTPLFDRLIATAGFSNLVEGWAELTAGSATQERFFTQGKKDLEIETGGTPLTVPGAYQERSSALRAPDIAASGVTAVTLVHGLADGTVPVDQSIEMALALTAAGVPVELILAGGRPEGTESGSTLDSTILGLLGVPSTDSPLVGHPSDPDPTNVVAATGFSRLSGIFDGAAQPQCLLVTVVDAGDGAASLDDGLCAATSVLGQLITPAAKVLSPLTRTLFGLLPR
jgi:acetyl esterase/lipase